MCCYNNPVLVKARLSDVRKFGFDRFHGYKVFNVSMASEFPESTIELCKRMGVPRGSKLAPKMLLTTAILQQVVDLTSNVLVATDGNGQKIGDTHLAYGMKYPLKASVSVGPGVHLYKSYKAAKWFEYPSKSSYSPYHSKPKYFDFARLFVPMVGLMEDYMAEESETIVFKQAFFEDHIWKQLLDYFLPNWEIT